MRVYKHLYAARLSSSPGRSWIGANLSLAPDGQVRGVDYPSTPNSVLKAKFESALERAAPLGIPPDYLRCLVDQPLRIRVEVQGEDSQAVDDSS